MRFLQARFLSPGRRSPVRLIVIHTAECSESQGSAWAVASWFASPISARASAHYTVDRDEIVQSVRDEDTAWHAGPVNGYSIGVEHAGYARQTPADWADDYSTRMLARSAELVGMLCARYAIPVVRPTLEELREGAPDGGICGHVDVTHALTGGKGHTDPGKSFPWGAYLEAVARHVEERARSAAVAVAPTTIPPTGLAQVLRQDATRKGVQEALEAERRGRGPGPDDVA